MRLVRSLALLLVCALVLAGCGGGDDGDGAGDATTTVADGEGQESGDDDALAEEAVLQLSDFPPGWTEGEAPDEDDSDEDDTFDACPELQAESEEIEEFETAEAESPQFSRGETTFVDSTVTVWEDEDAAERAFALFERDDVTDCLALAAKEGIEEEAGEALEVGQPVARESSAPDAGDEAIAFQITLPVTAEGTELVFYLDLLAVRGGRAGALLSLVNLGQPFDGALAQQLAETIAERMAA
jgi:hypothetical protein